MKAPKKPRLKRGKWKRLPNGHGSIRLCRNGAVEYREPARRK